MSLEIVTRRLSPRQNQVLEASARLDYLGFTYARVQDKINIGENTVKDHYTALFKKLNVGDIFSAVAYALNKSIIDLSDVVVSKKQLEDIIRIIENRKYGSTTYLTSGQYSTLRACYSHSLETGNSILKQVAVRLQPSPNTIKIYVRGLYKKTPASNRAQLAVIGYVQDQLIKGEDVRKQYKVSAQPAPG